MVARARQAAERPRQIQRVEAAPGASSDGPGPISRDGWLRYGVAVGVVFLAWSARSALTPWVGPTALPYVFFFPAIAIAAWFGGLGPGLLALALAEVAAEWSFFEPLHQIRIHEPVAVLAFVVASCFVIGAIEVMHRATRRLAHEVAERRWSEVQLARARDVLATTLESIGDGVIVTNPDGRVTFLNPEAERLTGWTSAEASGRLLPDVFRIVNEDTRETVEDPVQKVLSLGVTVGLANHTLLISRSGTETPIDDSAAPVRQPGGPLEGVVLVFRDVTEQRRAAAAQARLAAIVASSGDAILSKDLDGTILTWNAGAQRMFGYAAEEIVGRPVTVLIPPRRLDEETRILERLRAGQSTERLDTVRLAKDGREIPVSVSVSALKDRDGRLVGASKVIHDMTGMVAAQTALAREKELLATTLSSIGDAVIATDAAGKVTLLNPTAQELTGWTEADAKGRPLTEIFRIVNEQTRQEVENPALRAMREGAIVGLANHTVLLAKDGVERAIDDSAAPIRDEQRRVIGAVLVFRDVTERRRLDDELSQSRDRLREQAKHLLEADRRKNEFLATLAHELRNPLAPIKNGIAVLQLKGPPDRELVWARDVIDRQVHHMARLLDDLLDVNRLGRNTLELRRSFVTLAAILESAVETTRPYIANGRHELSIDVPEDPIRLHADPVRLAQVFGNLLHNAAKYTDPGGRISLSAARVGGEAIVRIRDSGIGIAPDALPRVFEMFSQLPAALPRSQGGVGVGLALCRGLVELHGGTIEAHSEGAGHGTEFTVRLPITIQAEAPSAPAPTARDGTPTSAIRRRILIADDLQDNTDTLAMMLRMLGHDVHAVYDGESAVEAAEKFRPEVVLLDIGMPKLDGYEACRRIRSHPWGRSMFVIAQTGWGQEEDLRRAADAGFDHHVLKPVDAADLVLVLARIPASQLAGRAGA